MSKQPFISIVTPVFNAEKILPEYFAGIEQTTYPKEKIEIIMPDGGSNDRTKAIAKQHGAKILENSLKTGEAGKAVGVKYVLEQAKKHKEKTEDRIICLLDSDNIITEPDWFDRMTAPFSDDAEIIGTEPWEYTYRRQDPYITRYAAMIGMSDPLTLFLGNYDRINVFTDTWTKLPIKTQDKGDYIVWTVDPKVLPTIGANGTCFRLSFFDIVVIEDFLFDIDVLYEYTLKKQARFAKVKIGIVHIYCRSIHDFIRKQSRRIKDFHYFNSIGLRKYPWSNVNKVGILKFIASCVTVVPLLWQALLGLSKKPDVAWLFHPLACWITLWVYGSNFILNRFRKPTLTDRTNWRQT